MPPSKQRSQNAIRAAAFDAWWATMKAKGYDYGYEALCNTRTGFDGARSTLAQKVIETVEAQRDSQPAAASMQRRVLAALSELFQREGIDLPITQEAE